MTPSASSAPLHSPSIGHSNSIDSHTSPNDGTSLERHRRQFSLDPRNSSEYMYSPGSGSSSSTIHLPSHQTTTSSVKGKARQVLGLAHGEEPFFDADQALSQSHHSNGSSNPHGAHANGNGRTHDRTQSLYKVDEDDPFRDRRDSLALAHEHDDDDDHDGSGYGERGDSAASAAPLSLKAPQDMGEFAKEMTLQTAPVLTLTLVGLVLTGEMLNKLQRWRIFIRVEELFILVPILLNLKGNLEMNLAARFSTSANIGELDIRSTRRSLVLGNLALLQVQALLVSFFAGLLSFILGLTSRFPATDADHAPRPGYKGWTPEDAQDGARGGYFECAMVLCASMFAASASSGVSGSFMCSLVIASRKWGINPDNIATPIAAALGDVLTLALLAFIGRFLGAFEYTVISTLLFLLLLGSIFVQIRNTFRNAYVQELLFSGWVPLFTAMVISSGTGLVLQSFVNEFHGYALLAPVVTGMAGSVGAVFVSRISTSLHANSMKQERYHLVAGTLFGIAFTILSIFLAFAWATGQVNANWRFFIFYLFACAVTTAMSLTLAYQFCLSLWRRDWDPDLHALPLLSSVVDVIGQLILALAFTLAHVKAPEGLEDLLAAEGAGADVPAVGVERWS